MRNPAVCLNMIVKNERDILDRCLGAAAAAIDAWVICDTGSSDGTTDQIRTFFAERRIPGELHEFPFVNFAQARNEALTRCKASSIAFDYVLFADADMELIVADPNFRSELIAPAHSVRQLHEVSYFNTRLLRRDADAHYVGVTHEYLSTACAPLPVDGLWFLDHASGSNRTGKFDRDIALLTEALASEPVNHRYVFYLAQSYRDAGHLQHAHEKYTQRAKMGGWAEEVWFSLYQIAVIEERIGSSAQTVQHAYLAAYASCPTRAEPLYQLARYHRVRQEHGLGYLFAKHAASIPMPDHQLFLEESVYRWRALDEVANTAYYVGALDDGRSALSRLLAESKFPESERTRIFANCRFYGLDPTRLCVPPGENVGSA